MKRTLITISLLVCVIVANAQSDYKSRLEERALDLRGGFKSADEAFNKYPTSDTMEYDTDLIIEESWEEQYKSLEYSFIPVNRVVEFREMLKYQELCYADSIPIYKWYYIEDRQLKSDWFKWGNKPDVKYYQLSSETKYIHPKKATFEGFVEWYKNN